MNPLALLRRYRKVYLATPYQLYDGGPDEAAKEAARIAGELMVEGVVVFSPIAHSHAIAANCDSIDPNDLDFWNEQNVPEMEDSEALVVAQMRGWENSSGIQWECDFFRSAGRPVHFLDPVKMELR